MSYFTEIFVPNLLKEFTELLSAPAINPGMGWIITPLIITLILMTFYFGRYKDEELGYNTAIGNSVVLLFVGMDLLRYMYYSQYPPSIVAYELRPIVTLIVILVMFEAITLMYSSFFHALPKKIAYFICAPLPVNLQAYVAIAIVYSNISVSWFTLLGAIMLFFVLLGVMKLLQVMQHLLTEAIHKAKIKEAKEEKAKAEQLKKKAKKTERELKKKEKEHKKK